MTAVFRILVVCSGNVCRSPLAERLLRARLDAALGPAADRVEVSSAGTSAVVGAGMDPRAATVGAMLGASADGFVARSLEAAHVAGADLVLGATRQHRAAAVRLHPQAHRYAFTVREFARLLAAVRPEEIPPGDPVLRGRAVVTAAAARRGLNPPARAEDDDVADPAGGMDRIHREVGVVLDRALKVPVAVLAGRTAELPAPPRSARRAAAGRGPRDRSRPGGAARGARRSGRPARASRRRFRRVALRGGAGLLGLLAVCGAWVAIRGLQAQHALVAARAEVATVRGSLLTGDVPAARAALARAQEHTRSARDLTGDPVWRTAASVPYAGANASAVRTVASTVDGLATSTLPALVRAAGVLDPAKLRISGDRIDVGALAREAPVLDAARTDVVAARGRLDDIDTGALLGPVAGAVAELRSDLADTAGSLDGLDRASRLVPSMLGAARPRRYLVVFQNNAEARGTGGLVGAYAVVTATNGRLKVTTIGSNTDLHNAQALPVELGKDFRAAWGDDPALWVNSNLDANFPNAARIWLALWQRQTGQALDGVLATDPVALGYLLAATGQVRLQSGEVIDAVNAVRLTMRDVYDRSTDNAARDSYLRSVAGSVVQALISGRGTPRAVLDQLLRAAGERRLLLYSAHASEQRDIARTSLSGTLPELPGPYAYVVVNNAAGNKMDYYLQRSVDYAAGSCASGRRTSRITVTFGNAAPSPDRLPEYVSARLDVAAATRSQSTATGSLVELVSVYGPLRSGVLRATLDGRPVMIRSGRSGSRPLWTFPLVVPPRSTRTLVLDISEPAAAGTPVVPVQPLVRPAVVSVSGSGCS